MSTTTRTASEIMTPEVISVSDSDRVADAAQLLLDAGISGVPVVDRWGNAVGVFTLVHAAMSRNDADANGRAEQARADLAREDARADEWFYRLDLVRKLPIPLPAALASAGIGPTGNGDDDQRVRDVMTPRVHSVRSDCPIAEVTSYLLDRAIHRVFVRDEENKLVGIITSMDLLRVLGDLLDERVATAD